MKYIRNNLTVTAGIVILSALAGFMDIQPERPDTGFWAMEGQLLTHVTQPDPKDSLSGNELYELQDEKGLTIWFGKHVFKDVCMTGQCKMMRLWLFWDGAGNYLGFQIPEGEPLTKSDHTEFIQEDYQKLHHILLDTSSILKDLKPEDLTVEDTVRNSVEVDGYTAATRPALSEVVVRDAVYTCHTLWHTAYGSVREEILAILHNRISTEYLGMLFNSGQDHLKIAAISYIAMHQEYHPIFLDKIIDCIASDDAGLSSAAVGYLRTDRYSDGGVQRKLAAVIPRLPPYRKYEIIWKFAELREVDKEVVIGLLDYFENEIIGVGSLNVVYRLINPGHMDDPRLVSVLERLAGHGNAYVRNLTIKLLAEKQKTSGQEE